MSQKQNVNFGILSQSSMNQKYQINYKQPNQKLKQKTKSFHEQHIMINSHMVEQNYNFGDQKTQISCSRPLKQNKQNYSTFINIKTNQLIIRPKSTIKSTQQNEDSSVNIIKRLDKQYIFQSNQIIDLTQNKSSIQKQNYVKKLKQFIPQGKTLTTTIQRQKSCLSLQLRLMIKNQLMFNFQKVNGFFQPNYQITSQGQHFNTVGYMKSNITGSIFNIYEQISQGNLKLVGTIYYNDLFRLKNQPRFVQMYIFKNNKQINGYVNVNRPVVDQNLKKLYETDEGEKIMKLINLQPAIDENNQYTLNFNEQQTILPSIKNLILVQYQTNKQALKFYKIQKNIFKLKVKDSLSAFLAYCFAVSSLLFKWACQ